MTKPRLTENVYEGLRAMRELQEELADAGRWDELGILRQRRLLAASQWITLTGRWRAHKMAERSQARVKQREEYEGG